MEREAYTYTKRGDVKLFEASCAKWWVRHHGAFLAERIVLPSLLFVVGASHATHARDYPFITVDSTASLEQFDLLGYLLPVFTQTRGIDVLVAAVGTGQTLAIGKRGECDVVLVHDKARELQFMRDGLGSVRRVVMRNSLCLSAANLILPGSPRPTTRWSPCAR